IRTLADESRNLIVNHTGSSKGLQTVPRRKHQMDPEAAQEIDFSTQDSRAKGPWLRDSLTSLILSMTPGDLFPSDRVLAERYQVARMTVNREVNDLAARGLLERIPGQGTCVRRPSGAYEALTSCTGMTTGYQAAARVVSVRQVKPPGQQVSTLGLEPGERVLRIRRVR